MKSRFRRFILISLLVHIFLLVLFSYSRITMPPEKPFRVDLSLNNSRSSASSTTSSASQSRQKNQNQKFKKFNKSSIQKQKTTSKASVSSKKDTGKNKTPSLIKNTPPSAKRPYKNTANQKLKDKTANRQITLNKSKKLTRSAYKSTDAKSEKESDKSEKSGFGEKSVFGKTSSASSGDSKSGFRDFDLEKKSTDSSGGGASGSQNKGNSASGQGNKSFDWKNSGQRNLVSHSDLVFPKNLKGKGVHGKVIISFKVDPSGKVYEVELIKSSGYSELDNAVKEQVRSFRFNSVNTKKINEAEYSYLFKLAKK